MYAGHVSRMVDTDEKVGTPFIAFQLCISIHHMDAQVAGATEVSRFAS